MIHLCLKLCHYPHTHTLHVHSTVVADPDQNVKNGSELLDRLLKDIVTESSTFDVQTFIPVLRERMYTKVV